MPLKLTVNLLTRPALNSKGLEEQFKVFSKWRSSEVTTCTIRAEAEFRTVGAIANQIGLLKSGMFLIIMEGTDPPDRLPSSAMVNVPPMF